MTVAVANFAEREVYTERRAHAFRVGEQRALQRAISADAYLFLYKELVRLAGERTYCWAGQTFLVNSLATSISTVKRWFHELEQAGLIKRVARPGGQTSITYITAYLQSVELLDATESADDPVPMDENTLDSVEETESERLFFVPAHEPNFAPTAGPTVMPHTVKIQKHKIQVCGSGVQLSTELEVSTSDGQDDLLAEEGVMDSDTFADLRTLPTSELAAISTYLDRQTNVRSRPALFVWLARKGFGQKLLEGRAAKASASRHAAAASPPPPPPTPPTPAVEDEIQALWHDALEEVRREVPRDEFITWIAPSRALLIDDPNAVLVVGSPNVFVRDHLDSQHRERLETVVSRIAGTRLQIEFVIGT